MAAGFVLLQHMREKVVAIKVLIIFAEQVLRNWLLDRQKLIAETMWRQVNDELSTKRAMLCEQRTKGKEKKGKSAGAEPRERRGRRE